MRTDRLHPSLPAWQAWNGRLEIRHMASPRRVLVIEDNFDAAESLRLVLEMAGHDVSVAHSGEEGLTRADEMSPEIVLCDLGLPDGMSGLEVAKALRARHGAIELVALTGSSGADVTREILAAGFDKHVIKPVEPKRLYELVGR
jgi:two-component system CheB/CheR fusion protein